MTIYTTTVYTQPNWHWQAISAPKFMCTNTEYMRPRVSKELFLARRVESYSYGILLLHTTSDTPLDIQNFQSVMDTNLYSRRKEIFWIEKEWWHYILWFLLAYKYIVSDGANSYLDANARNQIHRFHVQCSLCFKQEWQSSKCKAEQGKELFYAWTCASVKVGVIS